MAKMLLWNNYEFAKGRRIFVPFGKWPWNEDIDQVFDREHAEKIAAEVNADVAKGEPGIPVYQGHPDVPDLAAKYPDKGALGWIVKIEVEENGVYLTVEWDRFPGKGFAWFSPYWSGDPERQGGKVTVTVDKIRSIGLVNRPNIHAFRLPNEELVEVQKEKAMKGILQALGLAETATEQEAIDAIGKLKADAATCEASKVALEDECKKQKCCNEELQKKVDEQATALANSAKEVEETKAALANEKAEHDKLKALKTASVTKDLPNEQKETMNRLALVNEIMAKRNIDFDTAWAAAKSEKPDLFK